MQLLGPTGKGFVFRSPRDTKPIHPTALTKAVRRAIGAESETGKASVPLAHFTPHDLRRTAASQMAAMGFGVIVDKILNHTDQRVTAIYDRYSYDKEKQQALEAWGRKLQNITGSPTKAKVINLSR